MHPLKAVEKRCISVLAERVEVTPDGTGEEGRILKGECQPICMSLANMNPSAFAYLRNDSQARSQVVEFELRDIQAVDVNASRPGLQESEQRKGQR